MKNEYSKAKENKQAEDVVAWLRNAYDLRQQGRQGRGFPPCGDHLPVLRALVEMHHKKAR